ncbi:MAG: hypothetical protein JWR55_258 [Aeromicrobium sp.]|nr:hypothetical protein [Aeromicrobium sp.]
MTTPLPELLAAVPSINDPQEPFVFTVDGDTLKLGGKKEFFKGKSSSKQFHWEIGGIRKDDDGDFTAAPLTFSFETSRIKEPLFTYLEQHGWHRSKGFLGGLFGR